MINYFFWGTIILFVATVIFYISCFLLFYYWRVTKENWIVPPLIFTFEFFLAGFLIISAISLVLNYLPDIIKLM